jgi:hypothetical protein
LSTAARLEVHHAKAFGVCRDGERMRPVTLLLSFAILQTVFARTPSSGEAAAPSAVLMLEDNWSRDMWRANGGMFYSGYLDLDQYLGANSPAVNPPPLTMEYQRKAEQLRAAALANRASIDPDAKCHVCGAGCLPYGIPLVLTMPEPFKFQFSPSLAVVLSTQGYRKILTDIHAHPRDLDSTYNGHSIGRWEGDTFVVDTIGLNDITVIEPGLPHSNLLHVVERWRQIAPDELENRIEISDPKALTHTWAVVKTYQRLVGVEPREKPCM